MKSIKMYKKEIHFKYKAEINWKNMPCNTNQKKTGDQTKYILEQRLGHQEDIILNVYTSRTTASGIKNNTWKNKQSRQIHNQFEDLNISLIVQQSN
jgi:hypothetical protein